MSFLKSIWKANSKHKKLSEELALQNAKELSENEASVDIENDVVTFKLKYLGSTVVEKLVGENISTEAVKNIIKTTKAGRKKLQRVNIHISIKGIAVTDLQGNDVFKISIYRISNCSTDPTHKQIFSFISTDTNETMECHAFVCSKRKMAETVTLAIAHAFSTAYEAWRLLPNTQDVQKNAENNLKNISVVNQKNECMDVPEDKLIDFDSDVIIQRTSFAFNKPVTDDIRPEWVCFDDDFGNECPPQTPYKMDLILA